MAGPEKVVLEFEANMAGMQSAIASIPGMTEKEAKKAVKELRKSFLTAEKAAKKAAKASGKAFSKTHKDVEQTGEGLKRIAQAVGGKTGEMAGRVEALGQSVGALASPMGLAAAAVAGVAAATLGLTAAAVKAVLAADELVEELKGLEDLRGFELIEPEQLASIETFNTSVDALAAIGKQAAVVYAAEFGPALEQMAVRVVAASLAGLDFLRFLGNSIEGFEEFRFAMIQHMLTPMDLLSERLIAVASIIAKVAKAIGADELAGNLHAAVAGFKDFRSAIDDAAVSGFEIVDMFGDYTPRAQELLGTLDDLAEAEEKTAKATEKHAKAQDALNASTEQGSRDLELQTQHLEDQAAAITTLAGIGSTARKSQLSQEQKLEREYADQLLQIQSLAAIAPQNAELQAQAGEARLATEAAYYAEVERMSDEQAAKDKANRLAQVDGVMAATSQMADAADALMERRIANADMTTQAGRMEAAKAFNTQKRLAIVQVLIDAAAATMRAFAQFGPPPSPAGIAAAAASAATAAISIGTISAQQPEFPMGGIVPSLDHRLISAQPGEAVLNRQAVNRLGPSGIDALNNGRAGVGEVVVVNRYEHRIFDAFMADHLAQGGPLSNALNRRSGPPGHSRRRR
jgi:hypothetical protein